MRPGYYDIAPRCHTSDATIQATAFVDKWEQTTEMQNTKTHDMSTPGQELVLKFDTEEDSENVVGKKIPIEKGYAKGYASKVKKFSSPLHSTLVVDRTSVVPVSSIKSALQSASPEDNFSSFQRIQYATYIDMVYVVFTKPKSRMIKRLAFQRTQSGTTGEPWTSPVFVDEKRSGCGSTGGHSADAPCPKWYSVGAKHAEQSRVWFLTSKESPFKNPAS